MIVTSKRCYLNILTQLMDVDTLLNANYYIADVRAPERGSVDLMERMAFNEYGQLVVENNVSSSIPPSSIGKYYINYGNGELDPTPFTTNTLVGIGETCVDPYERFINHLNNTETMISTYNFLFRKELRGNGLQILIFNDDLIVEEYLDIVCNYLAKNFGCDITFIDPLYRPSVKGQAQYVGDKVYAEKTINDLRDAQLLIDFNTVVTQNSMGDCVNNLINYLGAFDAYQIVHLYNLLFPNDPLPPDNYTVDHIKQIIIGRVSQDMPKTSFNNLFLTEDYLEMLRRYEREEADYSQDDSEY